MTKPEEEKKKKVNTEDTGSTGDSANTGDSGVVEDPKKPVEKPEATQVFREWGGQGRRAASGEGIETTKWTAPKSAKDSATGWTHEAGFESGGSPKGIPAKKGDVETSPEDAEKKKALNIILDKISKGGKATRDELGLLSSALNGGASTPGMPSVNFGKMDDLTGAIDKSNTLFKKFLDFAAYMSGALNPEDIQKVKASVPGGLLMKVSDLPIPEIEKIKYDNAEQMARVAVMSTLGGMFQTARGSEGVISGAGAESLSSGVDAIQLRADQVDGFNRAIDVKNAEFLQKRYNTDVEFAKAYNDDFNELQKTRNKAVLDYMTQKNVQFKTILDNYQKYGTSALKTGQAVEASQRLYSTAEQKEIGVRAKARGDFIIRSERNRIDRIKAKLLVVKAGNDLKRQGVMDAKDYMDSMVAFQAMGLPLSYAATLADAKVVENPDHEGAVNDQTAMLSKHFTETLDGFLWDTDEQDGAKFLNAVTPLVLAGYRFTNKGLKAITDKIKSGQEFKTKTDIWTGDLVTDANAYPEIVDLIKKGQILQAEKVTDTNAWQHQAAQVSIAYQALNKALEKGDNKLANKIKSQMVQATGMLDIVEGRYKDKNNRNISREEGKQIGVKTFIRFAMINKNKFKDIPGYEVKKIDE